MFQEKHKNFTFLLIFSITIITTAVVVVDCLFITSTFDEKHQQQNNDEKKQQKKEQIKKNNKIENDAITKLASDYSISLSENRKLFKFVDRNENESIFAKNLKYEENLLWNSHIDQKYHQNYNNDKNLNLKKLITIKNRRDLKDMIMNYDNLRLSPSLEEHEIFSKNIHKDTKGNNNGAGDIIDNSEQFNDEKYLNSNDDVIESNDENQNLYEYIPTMKIKQSQTIFNRRHIVDKLMYTKEIILKQGRVKGIIRNMHPQSGLKDVDQYLGLPYAEAPVGSRRFMPPGRPLPWNGIKIASHLPPVCPQNLPENGKTQMQFSKGRFDQLVRLFAYLKNESEDCLYLNVYVPKRLDASDDVPKYPVIVYIHGESYEWNSGNPYDGSVLASYGQTIIVTINYRIGVLGFLKPGISEHTVTNFGLLDQIAALQWVKDNIESFGGDSNSVTLMGHGTGAACVNFLMVSPTAKGLFHRAVLMSGSAMSDWAISNNSLSLTMQIAHSLNCPLSDDDDQFLNCLRKRRYQDIMKAPRSFPQFSTAFGPIVDGLVIPNQPYKVMEQYTDLFSRYDLLFGVTEVESYHMLNSIALEEGLRENERDGLLRAYLQHRFEIRPDLALAATLNRYTDIYNNPTKASTQEHRDVVLDILSDARVVGPVIQTGVFHAKVNPRSYMYVFGHNSEAGANSQLPHSIVGEELAFVFGAPLAPAGPFHQRYSIQEKLLSEAVMRYWTNFAKTGNPKAPWKDHFLNLHPIEWDRYDIDWPEFNPKNQCYVNIGIPPSLGYRYREVYMKFWNKELPNELNQISMAHPPPFIHFFPPNPANQIPRGGTSINPNEIIPGRINNFPVSRNNRVKEDSLRTLKLLLQDPLEKADNMYNAQPTSKVIKSLPDANEPKILLAKTGDDNEEDSDKTLHILIGVIVVVLVINTILGMIYFIRRKRKKLTMNNKLGILSYDGATDDDLKKAKHHDGDDSYILDIVKKTSKKSRLSPINGFKVTRKLSNSTVDAHIKVSDWITQDMVDFGSKSSKASTPTLSFKRRSFLKKPKKVSVGIDATPQTRSGSILKQEPIEITKFKNDNPRNIIICQDVEIAEELLNPDEMDSVLTTPRDSIISSTSNKESILDCTIGHSETYYTASTHDEKVTSFIAGDINVTSRDDDCIEKDPLSPEEQLQTIKRRNFPKVLPSYPLEEKSISQADKRKSLPSPTYNLSFSFKTPPLPPPRTSTLGRYPSTRRHSNSITTSPLMLAKDPEEEEPKITENTLIVGPLLPKSQESIYCTIHNKKRNVEGNQETYKEGNEKPQTESTTSITTEPRPSSIRQPQLISFQSLPSVAHQGKQQTTDVPFPKPLASVHRVFPIKDYGSKIPQLKLVQSPNVIEESNGSDGRDKITPESSSSDTNSSIVTVKTDLKQK